ncbi:hypothetical protein C2E25_16985 [Geothermobacter hydrogeniphilus]|uniref:Major paralogous domain-containing protein n=1 Tax=Geothermobacter hydrogeniphilus TaxID=1969733 RepID=A0A2K2H5Q0_9BACT|nr:hypothetical protein [Geothermobacter hydrogeniphilus]PNU18569.1 hypothetical protein C2E25_16985 [Geothermobacter hydrogeniphilus]
MTHRLKSMLGMILLAGLLTAVPLLAAVPNTISYQGVLTDAGGTPLTGSQTVVFRLFSVATGGTPLWEETRNVSLQNGTYQVQLGTVTPLPDTVFSGTPGTWLEVTVGSQTLTPRQHLDSVPYAFQAKRADSAATADNAATQTDLATHAGNPSAHHARYTDAEAVAAATAANMIPGAACSGQGQVLQWDGSQWVCVNLDQLTPSGGHARGFELTDSWGKTWDGVPRPAATWADANAKCQALGGRLPTITELYRNNGTTGTGELTGVLDTTQLWTQIADSTAGNRVQVTLADGSISSLAETSSSAYRCVWPDQTNNGFSGDACYGPAGAECHAKDRFWHVDTYDRPALPYAVAANECRAVDASLPTVRDYQELIQAGLENPGSFWRWASDVKYWYSGGYGHALVGWSGNPQSDWFYTSTSGSGGYSASNSSQRFRCIGRDPSFSGTPIATDPGCKNGDCFTLTTGKTLLVADNQNRAEARFADAAEACRALGADLPDAGEFGDLVRAGWGNGNGILWASEPVYWYNGNYGVVMLSFSGTGSADWSISSSTMSLADPAGFWPYRCVWHEKVEPVMNHCKQNERAVWNGSGYSCQAATAGDSGGNANPGGIQLVDNWGNAWDLLQRAQADYATASATCQGLGGRLPTATEVYRVRANQTLATTIGDANSTSYLWTLNPSATAGQRSTIRVSDGDVSALAETSVTPYRCVWPGAAGDIFGSRACYGDPAASDGCFTTSDLRSDSYDRASLTQPAAAWECAFYGGRLPDLNDLQSLIHAGAPNGSGNNLWSAEPIFMYNGNTYGYATFGWSGTGTAGWTPDGYYMTFSLAPGTALSPFRCVYSNQLK